MVDAGRTAPPKPTPPAEFTIIDAKPGDVSNLATRFVKFLSQRSAGAPVPPRTAGTVTIGRANDSDI
ncbi:MAG: transport system ATP-binding/permease protein, partial [Mycobacterium sp.]|nr:transport system ATP-binding/permease protein [Mycobacterium sp.]